MWKRRFCARHPSKSECRDVKTKLSCETSLKKWKRKLWKRSFCARQLFKKSESGRCENAGFVRDLPQKVNVEMWKRSFRARSPSKTESGRCENDAFVRDIPQNLKVADVKMKLLCGNLLKIWKLNMWERSFRARLPDFLQNLKVAARLLWDHFAVKPLCSVRVLCCETSLLRDLFAVRSLCCEMSLP